MLLFSSPFYPMIDDTNTTPSSHAITEARVWNRQSNLLGWQAYLGRKNPVATMSRPMPRPHAPPIWLAYHRPISLLVNSISFEMKISPTRSG